MKRLLTLSSTWGLVAMIVITSFSPSALADSTTRQPVLVFRVLNLTQTSTDVIEKAGEYVRHIYGKAGVEIEWLNGNEPRQNPDTDALTLTIILTSERNARRMGHEDATGFALSSDGEGTRRAYVFIERVERTAAEEHRQRLIAKQTARGAILGGVIAHEAGHLMLPPNSHSPNGIMSARMNVRSVSETLRGNLLFSVEQSELIRFALRKRLVTSK